jgi:hypothetical protein
MTRADNERPTMSCRTLQNCGILGVAVDGRFKPLRFAAVPQAHGVSHIEVASP